MFLFTHSYSEKKLKKKRPKISDAPKIYDSVQYLSHNFNT